MSEGNDVAQEVITSYRADLTAAAARHSALIAEIEAELVGVSWELTESFRSFADTLSAALGGSAANQCEQSGDQDEAIGICENFVSDEVCTTALSFVTAVVESHGSEAAAVLIHKMVSESPLLESRGAGP